MYGRIADKGAVIGYNTPMATSLTLMSKLVSMLLSVVVGFIIVRVGLLRADDSKVLSNLVAFVLQPALIIHAMQVELTPERSMGFIMSALICAGIYVLWIAVIRLLRRPLHLTPVDETTLCYSNVGNLMLPVIEMVLGEEMMFYATALQIPFNLFIWTHGASTISGGGGTRVRKMLLNPNIIALSAGLVLMLLHVRLPEILYTTTESLTGAVAPVSMLVVGMVIAQKDLKELLTVPRAYLILAGRLIILPGLTMVLLALLGVGRMWPALIPVMQAVFLCLCAPPAATVSQLAVIYDEEPVKASTYNTLGMFFCILTIPLMNLLYQGLFPIR